MDYSGRSVIIVGPELNLTQCGIPKEMALEMFKPFVLRELIVRGIAPNVKNAKNVLERRTPEVFDILEEITKNHPVLLEPCADTCINSVFRHFIRSLLKDPQSGFIRVCVPAITLILTVTRWLFIFRFPAKHSMKRSI